MERRQNMQFGPMKVGGLWGRRIIDVVNEWSLKVNDDLLLDCFRFRPGMQAWIGEHVGKFANGAVYVNEIVHSEALTEKISFLMEELMRCQEADGYMGTFAPENRWETIHGVENCGWDPWVAKYCMMGLYAYYLTTKSSGAVACVKKLILLLNDIYGENGSYNLNLSDTHVGLASGSILEPLMLWYEITAMSEAKALADRIVGYYWTEDAPHTPHLLKNMNLLPNGLKNVGRGKAYEMMSCFVGLVEYARQTGCREYLDKVMLARDQIALYYRQLTGCMSEHEWFGSAMNMTEKADLENCVTFTWIQLNARLFEMTGEMRCIDCIEEAAFNHIMEAVSPDGSTWIYYSTLTGPKDITYWSQLPTSGVFKNIMGDVYKDVKDQRDYTSAPVTCCTTNGQRALGLTPQYACTVSAEGDIYVNLLFDIEKTLTANDSSVEIKVSTDFPRSANGSISIKTEKPCRVFVRVPEWADKPAVGGTEAQPGTYFGLDVPAGESCTTFSFGMKLRLMSPGFSNRGKYALAYGPMLLAVDSLPDGWKYDEIVLELPREFSAIDIKKEHGWPLIELGARRVAAHIGEVCIDELIRAADTTVTLRPYLFCGITPENRECSQRYEEHGLVYDRDGLRTEFRVTVPVVVI